MHPPVGRGLRHRPPVLPVGRGDRQALGLAPEVLRGVLRAVRPPVGLDVHVAVDVDLVGGQAEARHLGEEADVGVDAVAARLEQQRVPLVAELVGHLLVEDRGELALDGRRGHRRVEDGDVRPEVGVGRVGRHGRRRGGRLGRRRGRAAPAREGPLLVGRAGAVPQLQLGAVGGVVVLDVQALVGRVVDQVAGGVQGPLLGGHGVEAVPQVHDGAVGGGAVGHVQALAERLDRAVVGPRPGLVGPGRAGPELGLVAVGGGAVGDVQALAVQRADQRAAGGREGVGDADDAERARHQGDDRGRDQAGAPAAVGPGVFHGDEAFRRERGIKRGCSRG